MMMNKIVSNNRRIRSRSRRRRCHVLNQRWITLDHTNIRTLQYVPLISFRKIRSVRCLAVPLTWSPYHVNNKCLPLNCFIHVFFFRVLLESLFNKWESSQQFYFEVSLVSSLTVLGHHSKCSHSILFS